MTADPAAFIAARLDEDEAVAKAASPGPWVAQVWPDFPDTVEIEDAHGEPAAHNGDGFRSWPEGNREHVAHFHPKRALDEITAKRRILDLHGRMTITSGHPYFNDAHLTSEPMTLCKSCEPEGMWRRERSWPCRTLRLLALPYAEHPDYHEEWRL